MQIAQLRRGEAMFEPQPSDKCEFMLRYLDMMIDDAGERMALNKIKQLIGQFGIDLPYSAKLRELVHRSDSVGAALEPHRSIFQAIYDGAG
jgi:tRNA-dihydrouridine synthase